MDRPELREKIYWHLTQAYDGGIQNVDIDLKAKADQLVALFDIEEKDMPLLSDEEQDDCVPKKAQIEKYLAEPDDKIAASMSKEAKRLTARVILYGRNIAETQRHLDYLNRK